MLRALVVFRSLAASAAALLLASSFARAQEPAPPAPLAPAVAAEPAVPVAMTKALKEVPVDPARLARLGTKEYRLWSNLPQKRHEHGVVVTELTRKNVGTISIGTSASPERIVLHDHAWSLTGKLTPIDFELTYPANTLLAPMRLRLDTPGVKTTTDLTHGRYLLGWKGYKRAGEWPADTLTLPALLRLGAVLPHEPGVAYTFTNFTPIPEINIQANAEPIVCVGPSLCKVFGRKMPCTKFTWGDVTMWFRDCDGALIRLQRPGYVTLDLWNDHTKVPECCARPAAPADPLVPAPMALPGVPAPPREDRPLPAPAPAPMPKPADDPFGM